jgi:hypothetical protein
MGLPPRAALASHGCLEAARSGGIAPRSLRSRLFAGILCALLGACNQLGPAAIRNGRAIYNDAIVKTGDQQTLAMIVRLRYGETAGMLAVSSVTANIRVRAGASTEFQAWGGDQETAGNLVPLSTTIAYEENPTISYTPIDGAVYVRELLSPIPIDLLFLLLEWHFEGGTNLFALVKGVNGLRNPAFALEGEEPDGRFARFVELCRELVRLGMANWARSGENDDHFVIVFSRYTPTHTDAVAELLSLVGVSSDAVASGADVILPAWLSDGTTNRQDGLAVGTRSIADLFDIAGASMELPPEHVDSGLVDATPALGEVGELIRIRCSKDAPERALVAVKHHGWWHYIDAGDSKSKEFFRLLQMLISFRIAEAAKTNSRLPVLTVPVNR